MGDARTERRGLARAFVCTPRGAVDTRISASAKGNSTRPRLNRARVDVAREGDDLTSAKREPINETTLRSEFESLS